MVTRGISSNVSFKWVLPSVRIDTHIHKDKEDEPSSEKKKKQEVLYVCLQTTCAALPPKHSTALLLCDDRRCGYAVDTKTNNLHTYLGVIGGFAEPAVQHGQPLWEEHHVENTRHV